MASIRVMMGKDTRDPLSLDLDISTDSSDLEKRVYDLIKRIKGV